MTAHGAHMGHAGVTRGWASVAEMRKARWPVSFAEEKEVSDRKAGCRSMSGQKRVPPLLRGQLIPHNQGFPTVAPSVPTGGDSSHVVSGRTPAWQEKSWTWQPRMNPSPIAYGNELGRGTTCQESHARVPRHSMGGWGAGTRPWAKLRLCQDSSLGHQSTAP